MAGEPISISFLAGGKLESHAKQVKEGSWRFKSYDAATKTMLVECRLGLDEPVQIKITFVADDTIRMIPPNIAILDKQMLFRRKTK